MIKHKLDFQYKTRQNHYGFTLMEILIALFIFTIIASIIMTSVTLYINTNESLNIKGKLLFRAQRAVLIMSHDFRQAANYQRLSSTGEKLPSFIIANNENKFADFVHLGRSNPNAFFPRSTLQHVAYFYHDNKLIRRVWEQVDESDKKKFYDETLLEDITHFSIQVYTDGDYFRSYEQSSSLESLPEAVIIKFKLKALGTIRRVFKLTN